MFIYESQKMNFWKQVLLIPFHFQLAFLKQWPTAGNFFADSLLKTCILGKGAQYVLDHATKVKLLINQLQSILHLEKNIFFLK